MDSAVIGVKEPHFRIFLKAFSNRADNQAHPNPVPYHADSPVPGAKGSCVA
jgi:hypothetical protein